jgi:hypothetical protein
VNPKLDSGARHPQARDLPCYMGNIVDNFASGNRLEEKRLAAGDALFGAWDLRPEKGLGYAFVARWAADKPQSRNLVSILRR